MIFDQKRKALRSCMARKEGFALKPMREGEETIWTLLRSRSITPNSSTATPTSPHHLFLDRHCLFWAQTSLDVLYQGPTSYFNDSDSTVMEGIPVAAPHLNHAVILASGSVQIMMVALTPGLTAALMYFLSLRKGGWRMWLVAVLGWGRAGGDGEEECVTMILVKRSVNSGVSFLFFEGA
ncbi:hypothetical protein BJ165DRAFT_1410215 [Panaeolus papilionaceus]|nr:hypothetical protein BJ165DRAFT_1410215 [Panaeolus papilionaceus]